jgi:Zn-dependent M28 family amino/carboxypeptidase
VSLTLAVVACAVGLQRAGTQTSSPFNGERAYEDLKKIVGFGPRPAGTEALEKTRAYIIAELEKAGLKPQLDHFEPDTPIGRIKMANIRVTRPGTKPTTIALTGHYDTKRFDFRFDGASDGGSSAAWLLEMARATANLRLESNLEIIFLDGEEAVREWILYTDSVYGSQHDVARRTKAGDLKQLKAMILVDMIGDRNLNLRQEANSTPWLTTAIWNKAHALGFNREFLNDTIAIEDDHLPYLRAGVPSVDLIDFDYPHWHEASDTIDKTSARSLKVIGDVIYAVLPEIDKR